MSLDKNLFTLRLEESPESPGQLDAIEVTSGEALYRKQRLPPNPKLGIGYRWMLTDPTSDAKLATVEAASSTAKVKIITLHDPEIKVKFAFSGSMSFKWSFAWEELELEWRKDSCYILRGKPDPPVQISVTDPARKGKPASFQILDYNLKRFDIDDKKGLEILVLSAYLTLGDYTDGFKEPEAGTSGSVSEANGTLKSPGPQIKYDSNEITVDETGSVGQYARLCADILKDKSVLFVVLKGSTPEVVQKTVQIATEAKRLRYHEADSDEEELHQYLTWDTIADKQADKKAKKVIRLDDDGGDSRRKDNGNAYKPLEKLTIHLSKIPLPELQPKAAASAKPSVPYASRPRPPGTPSPAPQGKSGNGKNPSPQPPSPAPNKLTRPPAPSTQVPTRPGEPPRTPSNEEHGKPSRFSKFLWRSSS